MLDNILVYVKKGMYKENVEVGKKKTNVMLGGNGMHSTIITCSFNVVDGYATFKSATVGKDLFLFGGSFYTNYVYLLLNASKKLCFIIHECSC